MARIAGRRAASVWHASAGYVLVVTAIVFAIMSFGGDHATAQVSAPTSQPAQGQTPPAAAPKSFLPQRPQGAESARPPQMPTGFFDRTYYWMMQKQAEINRAMASAVRSLKQGGGWSAAMLLAGIGFLYGVLHAAGPGHGKAVISSYVLADGQTLRRGVLLSFMAAFVQALSALVLVALLVLVLKSTQADIKTTEAWLETASWAFVALFGAWLLWGQLRSIFRSRKAAVTAATGHVHSHGHSHDHRHSHGHGHDSGHGHHHVHTHTHPPAKAAVAAHVHGADCGCDHDHHHDHAHGHHHGHAHGHVHGHAHQHAHDHGHSHAHRHDQAVHAHVHAAGESCEACGHAHMPSPDALQKDWSWRRALALAFGIGIRPCTGAILVLVFAISQGLMWAGVLATFTMAIGTAITVSILAALAVGSRDLATRLAGASGGVWAGRVQQGVGLAGAALVTVLGASLFYASLQGSGPF
ncbi:MAG TPA: nickel/cobalt transporter [Hyphomicrobiaceae bacterium]|nr:nickel/cobalt transporter [Hyphomicrobiaceae bacterium]